VQTFFKKIPNMLSSKISLYIFLFLFFYLVLFPIIGMLIPAVNDFFPSTDVQLIFGNYTNVVSALGASIAAGTSFRTHEKMKAQTNRHAELENKIDGLHHKLDELTDKQ